LGIWVWPWDKTASCLRGRLQLHDDLRKHCKFGAMCNQCWFVFFDTEGIVHKELFHQDRRRMQNSIAMFWGKWGKTSSANVQTSGTTSPGPCVMKMLRLTRHPLCGSFWLLCTWHDCHPPPSLLNVMRPLWFFLFPKMKLKLKG
jgi:hypothetical protein